MRALLLLVVTLVASVAGCNVGESTSEPARIPNRLLEGAGGNGWEAETGASQEEPEGGMFSKAQSLVYQDRESDEGYPGTLTVTTLRALIRPTEASVRDQVQARIRSEAESRGVDVSDGVVTGERRLGNGAESLWFVYNGTVSSTGFFSARDARVKIYGEVFECGKATVVIVGLAQVTDVRSVGGVPLPNDGDPTTWREISADPRGSIETIRGSDGLAYNVQC